ncbi:hypothetical protein GOBAR_AA39506 [Gossypium barbadense]|uniref:Uncharacterized protein n=1 Tax=Gossypium barbadense TaxID=3634 RepID=A0A2P5VQX0_GOSBA|nr:hypothetical protein GOBAR_AA39506 [Gossypium barbadense]
MLSKFISVSETHFQNTETTLKNQQASVQGLKTQIVQLSELISEQPQGSLPCNTEPNPREQLNAINVQDEEGFVEPEPELQQETLVSKGQGEVDQNTNKSVNVEYKPRVPYPNTTRKDRSDEQFALSQMPNAMKFLKELLANKWRLDEVSHEISLKEVHEPLSNNSKGSIHEERRLQLKVGDKVLLDAADPHIVITTPNEEIPLTVLSIFPFGTVEVSHPKFGTLKVFPQRHGRAHGRAYGRTMSSLRGKKAVVPASKKRKAASSFEGPTTKICTPSYCSLEGPKKIFSKYFGPNP